MLIAGALGCLRGGGFAFGGGKVFLVALRTDDKSKYAWTVLLALLCLLFGFFVFEVGPTELPYDIMGELIMEIADA